MDYQKIIDNYYVEGALKDILLTHSRQVADRALSIAQKHPELPIDKDLLETAAMLHDIGIVRCDAPSIECFGTEPYIRHGLIGAEMLRSMESLKGRFEAELVARVCERHTGTGLTHEQIRQQGLPLPLDRSYVPDTMEEQVICYADLFYSKTHLELERTVEQTAKSLEKYGPEGVAQFLKWVGMFE